MFGRYNQNRTNSYVEDPLQITTQISDFEILRY